MAYELSDAALDVLLDQFPVLAGQPRQLTGLTGGLTNRNVKITTAHGSYVARCSSASGELLGIDRDAEFHNSVAAHRAGVGAPVLEYRPDLGILLIGYLEGVTLSDADFARPGLVDRVAASCRKLHAGPRFCNDFDMFTIQRNYLNVVMDNGFRLPDGYLDHAARFDEIRRALDMTPASTVPCNNDLLAANFVDDGQQVWIIDYEYSGNNDPCFELGNIWRECRLSLDQLEELITGYYGRPLRHKLARARLQGTVAQYGWTLWGCIQNGSSALDFDF